MHEVVCITFDVWMDVYVARHQVCNFWMAHWIPSPEICFKEKIEFQFLSSSSCALLVTKLRFVFHLMAN